MKNNRLNWPIAFSISDEVKSRLEKTRIEARTVFLSGLEILEVKMAEGFTPIEFPLPNSKMKKLSYVLEENIE